MHISVTDNAGDQWLFDWDPRTGVLSGPDGWWIDRLIELWSMLGALAGADQTTIDPRHSRAGMACFLAAHEFHLPDELRIDLSPCFWVMRDAHCRTTSRPRRFRLIRGDRPVSNSRAEDGDHQAR